MNLFAAFRRAAPSRLRRRASLAWVEGGPPAEPETPAAGEDPTAAAGSWFDSSWVLRAGLLVTEHACVEGVAADLPLGWWLEGPGATHLAAPDFRPSSRPCR